MDYYILKMYEQEKKNKILNWALIDLQKKRKE